ncbi:ion transporter [Jeongeupia chitinilytica]|uniref:Ion transporter n=1 Tax=Jeongeupia chitinilytica TaxID=1041641 RepID=A0ABQ3H1N3_9NEIS|nr:ion transporter [Jeongeupia chitinilytica]GHD65910.1 ion transporter [Jeongeupia chitinilytica]
MPIPLKPASGWRHTCHTVIFEHDTPAGRAFDLCLLLAIVASVLTVMLDSVAGIRAQWGDLLTTLEWGFTLLFTVEYLLRVACVERPWRYVLSPLGVIDLLSILPTYLGLLLPQSIYYLSDIRVLRLLRVFRVLKLAGFLNAGSSITQALAASRRKITLFIYVMLMMAVVLGTLMYVIEGEANGFTSIPRGIYWAIVTLTTLGYGDLTPKTGLGQALAAVVTLMGYGILAVPTGIVTAEFARVRDDEARRRCPACNAAGHDGDALFCRRCGQRLPD